MAGDVNHIFGTPMPCNNQDLMWILYIFVHDVRSFFLTSSAHSGPKIRFNLIFVVVVFLIV